MTLSFQSRAALRAWCFLESLLKGSEKRKARNVSAIYTQPRLNPGLLQSLWALPPFGGEGGIATEGDVLVNVTADGVDLNVIWAEVAAVIKAWNAERSALTSLLAFNTTNTADAIPQSRSADSFEEASEYGEPQAMRPPSEYALMGYTFKDYDKASRWTRFFLSLDSPTNRLIARVSE